MRPETARRRLRTAALGLLVLLGVATVVRCTVIPVPLPLSGDAGAATDYPGTGARRDGGHRPADSAKRGDIPPTIHLDTSGAINNPDGRDAYQDGRGDATTGDATTGDATTGDATTGDATTGDAATELGAGRDAWGASDGRVSDSREGDK
jgi:hypothetical protein